MTVTPLLLIRLVSLCIVRMYVHVYVCMYVCIYLKRIGIMLWVRGVIIRVFGEAGFGKESASRCQGAQIASCDLRNNKFW